MEPNKIVYHQIETLIPATYNPRYINLSELEGLKVSLDTFGMVDPIIINSDLTVIGGHQRLTAAKELGWDKVPCIMLELNKRMEKKLNVTLNNPNIQGNYDNVKLSESLNELKLDEDYHGLNLDKVEPLNLTSLQEGQAHEGQLNRNFDGIKSYMLIFASKDDQDFFLHAVSKLKAHYPDSETITDRLVEFLRSYEW